MLAGKKLYALIAAALSMAAGGVSYSYMEHAKKQESFFGDGYVLTLDESAGETTAEPVYFNAGTRYKVSYPETVSFKDTQGNKQLLEFCSLRRRFHRCGNRWRSDGTGTVKEWIHQLL